MFAMKGETLKALIEELGGPTAVARRLRSYTNREKFISAAAVSKWFRVPAKRCRELAALSGGRVTPEQLRPDVFGKAA